MFKLLRKRKEIGVRNISLLKNNLIILGHNKLVIRSDECSIEKETNLYFHGLFKIDDVTFLINYAETYDEGDVRLYSINKEFGVLENILHSFGSVISIHSSGAILSYQKIISINPRRIENGIFNLKGKTKLWSTEKNVICKFVNDFLISMPQPFILRLLNIQTGEIVIEHEVDEEYWIDWYKEKKRVQIKKIILITEDDIWVGLTNEKLLIIDSKTGVKKKLIENKDFKGGYEPNLINSFPDTGAFEFDEVNQKLIGLKNDQYYEVDLKTFLVSHFDLKDIFESANIRASVGIRGIGNFVFDETYIYFIDKMNSKIGAFDRQNKIIRWQFTFDDTTKWKVFPMKILKKEASLYVIDNKHNLHSFLKI